MAYFLLSSQQLHLLIGESVGVFFVNFIAHLTESKVCVREEIAHFSFVLDKIKLIPLNFIIISVALYSSTVILRYISQLVSLIPFRAHPCHIVLVQVKLVKLLGSEFPLLVKDLTGHLIVGSILYSSVQYFDDGTNSSMIVNRTTCSDRPDFKNIRYSRRLAQSFSHCNPKIW